MLASSPPMGWNSWDCFGTSVTEAQVLENAEFMRKYLLRYGWEYAVVDIEWSRADASDHSYAAFPSLSMDSMGRLMPDIRRFPSSADGNGFTALADRIHKMGLKFGIHIMRGVPREAAHRKLRIADSDYTCAEAADPCSVCAWNPDMYGFNSVHPASKAYLQSIFRLYADWGVDFVKCDDIAREYPHCRREIELISESCRSCRREIVLSLSPAPRRWKKRST